MLLAAAPSLNVEPLTYPIYVRSPRQVRETTSDPEPLVSSPPGQSRDDSSGRWADDQVISHSDESELYSNEWLQPGGPASAVRSTHPLNGADQSRMRGRTRGNRVTPANPEDRPSRTAQSNTLPPPYSDLPPPYSKEDPARRIEQPQVPGTLLKAQQSFAGLSAQNRYLVKMRGRIAAFRHEFRTRWGPAIANEMLILLGYLAGYDEHGEPLSANFGVQRSRRSPLPI